MKAFSNLLSDLILTSSRNRKLSLLEQYFSSTPDPDRGYALAALTGSLNFKNLKASFFKDLIKEKQDEHLFDLSYDYVGDLAETISLLWDQEKGGNMPRLSSLFENLKKAKTDELKNYIINILNISTADQRWAFIKLFTGGLRIGVSSRLVKQALANYGNVDLEEIEKIWHGLHFPYTNLFSWLENKIFYFYHFSLTLSRLPFELQFLHDLDQVAIRHQNHSFCETSPIYPESYY